MVKITTKIVTKKLDLTDERINPIEEIEFDTDNNGITLQRTLIRLEFIENNPESVKKSIEDVVVSFGNRKIHAKSSRELNLIIESMHTYAWALANDI